MQFLHLLPNVKELFQVRQQDEQVIKNNLAFVMENSAIKKLYSEEFKKKSAIYFGKQPTFDELIKRIHVHINNL